MSNIELFFLTNTKYSSIDQSNQLKSTDQRYWLMSNIVFFIYKYILFWCCHLYLWNECIMIYLCCDVKQDLFCWQIAILLAASHPRNNSSEKLPNCYTLTWLDDIIKPSKDYLLFINTRKCNDPNFNFFFYSSLIFIIFFPITKFSIFNLLSLY